MEEYRYKVSDFEGPLDLLLYLIEKNKVDIYHIPVAEIADQFNEYVAQIDFFDVNYGSKFFLMAATLLQIKSRRLLPKVKATEAEEEEDDPEEVLVRQLLEYKRMKLPPLWPSCGKKEAVCSVEKGRPLHTNRNFRELLKKKLFFVLFKRFARS